MARAITDVHVVDVMEYVAHDTDGPEPEHDTAEAWLMDHADAMEEAMYCAVREYVRKHWGETK